MAFTRKALKEIGLDGEQLEKVFALHGTSLSDYQLKSEFDVAVKTEVDKQTGEIGKKYEGLDIETLKTNAAKAEQLEKDLAAAKLNYTLENRLIKEGVVNAKAVSALLDTSKIKLEDGKVSGIDEQITALKESDPWAFAQATPKAVGFRQVGEPTQLTGVEAEFIKRNPGLKI